METFTDINLANKRIQELLSEIEEREKEISTLTSENNDLSCKNEDMENIDSEQVRELKSKLSQAEELHDKAIEEGLHRIRLIRNNIFTKGESELYGYCDQKLKQLESLKNKP